LKMKVNGKGKEKRAEGKWGGVVVNL